MFCLSTKCRQEQLKSKARAKCYKKALHLNDPALMEILKSSEEETEQTDFKPQVLSNSKSNKTNETENKIKEKPISTQDTAPTEIKPEERFQDVTEEEIETTDMDHFLQLMKEQGIPTLQERGIKRTNATISVIKRPYLMEPEILPYQDILDSIQNEKLKKESTNNKPERQINDPPENENIETNGKITEETRDKN